MRRGPEPEGCFSDDACLLVRRRLLLDATCHHACRAGLRPYAPDWTAVGSPSHMVRLLTLHRTGLASSRQIGDAQGLEARFTAGGRAHARDRPRALSSSQSTGTGTALRGQRRQGRGRGGRRDAVLPSGLSLHWPCPFRG